MMRPDSLSLLVVILAVSSSFLHPAASECVPRNSSIHLSRPFPPQASPSATPKASPAPTTSTVSSLGKETKPTPAPVPSPTLAPVNSMIKDVAEALSTAVHNAIGAGILKPICDKTDYPDICLSSIQSMASSIGSINFEEAASFQIRACAAKAQEAIDEAKKLVSDTAYGDCLKDCLDSYDDALDNLETARKALLNKDKGTLMSMLSATYDSFSCSDTFDEGHKLGECKAASPMEVYEGVLTKMSSNSLAICEQLPF